MAKSKVMELPTKPLPPKMLKQPSCESCVFWTTVERIDGFGVCRRYPPNISDPALISGVTSLGPQGKSPVTRIGDWCGEHKEK